MGEKTIAGSENKQRNIYEKMATVKTKLVGLKKGGVNEYSKYNYFELGDILPTLTPALQEERLYMKTQFSATEQVAKLIVVDIDNTESTIEFEIRFAECALKGAHEIQNLGAAQTYTRRYLIMTAFDIAEADLVDAGAEPGEKKEAQKKAQQTTPAKPAPPQEPQDDLNKIKMDIWELIKKLPQEDQANWVNACKGADGAKLKQLFNDLSAKLKAETQETAPEEEGQRLEKLKNEFYALVETLPEEAQEGWLDASHNATEAIMEKLLYEAKQKKAVLEEALKKAEQKKTGQQPAPKSQAAQQLAEEAAKPNPQKPQAAPSKGAAPQAAPAQPEIPIW